MSIRKIQNITDLPQYLLKYCYKEYVYCSIGSKLNEEITGFRYPSIDLKLNSNAEYQMIPEFVRNNYLNNLVIIIDQFSDEEIYNKNINLLKKIIKYKSNIEILLVHYRFDCNNINIVFDPLLQYLYLNNIKSEQFMFVNFICYKVANLQDLTMENTFRNLIQKKLNNSYDGIYNECYYQWYGYIYLTYNYIYNYKNYSIFIGLHLHQLIQKCYKLTKNELLFYLKR